MLILLINLVLAKSSQEEQLNCAIKLYYSESPNYLTDLSSTNTSMPYILTSHSPNYALDIQNSYKPSQNLNDKPYTLKHYNDAFVFIGDASQVEWIEIQEFKVKRKNLDVNMMMFGEYFGYFVVNGRRGGHVVISKNKLEREFRIGKTDSSDRYINMGQLYIVSWEGEQEAELIMKRFVKLLEESQDDNTQQDYCSMEQLEMTLKEIECNLDTNFNEITFHIPDLYHPPIHYHIGNVMVNTSLTDKWLIKRYPGLQVLAITNLQKDVLELRFPVKGFETNQKVYDDPGIVITIKEGNRGFIHVILFKQEESMVLDYKEDENLGYFKIGFTNQMVFVFSYVTSSFQEFPNDQLIDVMFQNCQEVTKQKSNICQKKIDLVCEQISDEYFHSQPFTLPKHEIEQSFYLNEEYFESPFLEQMKNINLINIKFEDLEDYEINNVEMNHAGYVSSFLRLTNNNTNININSLIISKQDQNIEVEYLVNQNIYEQIVSNVSDKAFVLVFVTDAYFDDVAALQLFREFIDHLQRVYLFEQIQTGCQADVMFFDVQPIQFNAVHKSIQFDDSSNDVLLEQRHQKISEKTKKDSTYLQEDGQKGEYRYNVKKKESLHPVIKEKKIGKQYQRNPKTNEDGDTQQRIEQADQKGQYEYNTYYQRDHYYQDDYRDRYSSRDSYRDHYGDPYYDRPILNGQTIQIPQNPTDEQLGRFFREVMNKMSYSDICDPKSKTYNKDECYKTQQRYRGYDRGYGGYDRGYGGYGGYSGYGGYNQDYRGQDQDYRGYNSMYDNRYGYNNHNHNHNQYDHYNHRQDDYYRKSRDDQSQRDPFYNSYYDQKACITVYNKCDYKGDSLQLCGHTKLIPKSQEAMEIYSIRAEEYYVIEFYVQDESGKSKLYTLKGSQPCLKYPLRVDQFLQ